MDTRLDVERDIEWWRPLVQGVLCIPHLLWTGVLAAASALAFLAIAVSVLFTGRVPDPPARLVVLSLRERMRTYAYFFVLRRDHPPFATALVGTDPGDDPRSELTIAVPATLPRSAIFRVVLVLPHILVLGPIGFVLDVGYPILMVVCAARRGWPAGIERLLRRTERWVLAVIAYALLVTDERPRFGLAAYDDGTIP